MEDLVNKLRGYAVDPSSRVRGYARVMTLAADEIVKLRAAVATEREECAKVCDKLVDQEIRTGKVDHNEIPWTMYCSNIIRARGGE